MPTNRLTDSACRSAKAGESPRKLFDGEGLFLWISTTGAKTWRLSYRIAGVQKTIGFGPYPDVTLAQARELRAAAKAKLRAGDDPMAPRRLTGCGLRLAEAVALYWEGRKDVSDGYRTCATRGLSRHVLPHLGELDVGRISRDDVLCELRRLDLAGRHVYVRKVRIWLGQVFDWAVEHGHCANNPAASIRPEKAFGHAPVEHMPSLDLREIPDLLLRLSLERELSSVLACRMLAYTWVRTGELRMMEWCEVDYAARSWTIPAGKMKRRREHVVQLSSQALAVLDTMRARATSERFVFQSDRRTDRPMSENAILFLLHRIGYKGRMTGHGWRSVASTWANDRGYSPDAIERQLAHVPGDSVRSIYNRAAYLEQRRRMLQDWADWLDECQAMASGRQTAG